MKLRILILIVVPLLLLLSAGKQRSIHIFMAGDSTMAVKPFTKTVTDSVSSEKTEETFSERGWGMLLPEFLKKNTEIVNLAQNGRSTRTFIEQGWWEKIITQVQPGDVVIIQFGHNDCAVDRPDKYTTPDDYRKNLMRFIAETRAKKANPILCTSIARRKFDKQGKIVDVHGVYPVITREVGKEMNVPLIDMYQQTIQWLEKTGVENSKKYFHKVPADGSSKLYPKGLDDNTHLNEAGARIVTGMFVKEINWQKIKPLYRYLKK
jgi:lysophospholipase L1-like esterase